MNNSEQDMSSQSLGSPNQNSMMFNMPQQGQQMGFNNRGGPFYPMQGNMMTPNMGSNMNYDWMQSGMGGGMNPGMSANNMGNYNNQMFPPMTPNMNSNDFFNAMMNNMYRNQGGQPQNMMMQQMNNPNQMMGSSGLKIDEALSSNMNALNQFYSYINSQNRNLMSGMNMPFGSNPYAQMDPQKSFDYQNDSMQLPNKTEFMQPMPKMGFPAYGAYPNDMSLPMPNAGSKSFLGNTSNTENLPTDNSMVQDNKAEERYKSKSGPNTRMAGKVSNENHEEAPIKNRNPEEEPIGGKQGGFDWEDRPIKPAKNGFDWEEKPNNASSKNNQNWEDNNPIKSKAPPKKKPQPKPKEEVEEAEDDHYQSRSNIPEYKNPYDEVQIGGQSGKRFEDLLEEQLKANPDAVSKAPKKKDGNAKREFLKRGTRTYLSSAAQRDPKILDESNQKQDGDSHNDSGVMTFHTTTAKPSSKGPAKGLQNKAPAKSARDRSNTGSSFPGDSEAATEKVSEKPKEPKKFLTRGGGTGGGIGNAGPGPGPGPADRSRKSLKEDPQERHEEERSKSSRARSRTDAKKSVTEDYNEKPVKGSKPQGKFVKPELSAQNHEDSYGDAHQSFEKEYGFEKYMKKSPRGQGKTLSAKRKESPKYNFDDDSTSNREEEENAAAQAQNFGDEPPVSNLVNKYFYKKKPITGKEKEKDEGEPEKTEEEDNMQKAANEKIETLNSEIARFKLENERVKKIRQKHDEMLKALNKDMADWNKQKEKEQREFEEWKQEEMKKIKNEKKLAERHQKTVSNMPSRKEREEIDNLKKQIAKLAEELQTKDKRAKLNMDRLKRQIEEAEQRNSELMDELRTLGKLNPKLAANNRPSNAYADDEEEQYDDHQNNGEVEDQDHDEENGDVERGKGESDEENGSDNENLNYEDIVNQPGARNTALNKANYDTGSPSPKFVNEKNVNLTTLTNKGAGRSDAHGATKSKGETSHHHRTSSTQMGGMDENSRSTTAVQNQHKFSSQDYRYDSNPYFKKYLTNRNEVSKIVNQTVAGDGKIQRIYADGKKEVIFHNGVRREIFPDGYTIVHFINNDIKQTLPDNTVIYFFADAQTTQTTLPTGRHVYRFANNQVEFHNPDGSKDIYFADQTRKSIFPNGDEETLFTDGTVQRVNPQKIKTITYASGQKDVVYPDGTKIRTYPDGRIRKHYPDGSTEDF